MRKKLDENAIYNELSGQSAFFRGQPKSAIRSDHKSSDAKKRMPERVNTRTGERAIKRHSFNFYADQITALRQMVARKTLDGERINLSNLVREALDDFLARNT